MSSPATVVDRPESSRFELHVDGDVAAFADYHLADGVLTIPHVETDPARRGHGLAAVLMNGVVDDVRRRGLRILPVCSYAALYLSRRPDAHDLVACD